MFLRLSTIALALFASAADAEEHVINQENGDIPLNSDAGRVLMENARRAQDGQYYQDASSLLPQYSVKFQGCHHVQQWNPDAQDEDDVRIMTKRLVRFRLCPSKDCISADTSGCTSGYGDYVVDMSTYLSAFMYNMMEGQGQRERHLQDGWDLAEYVECNAMGGRRELAESETEGERNLQDNGYYGQYQDELYVGPYCADSGGEIRLGVFTDDTCSAFANYGEDVFYQKMGFKLPYSSQSIAPMSCQSCAGQYGDGGYEANEFCSSIYEISGKCETKMSTGYPNESSCNYISGIKTIREDGVIRTAVMRKSKAASICIGVFLTLGILLGGYVYYLRTKLGRAKINLAASTQSLA